MNPCCDKRAVILFLALCLGEGLFCAAALAAQDLRWDRRVWDHLMAWVNFGILGYLFFKYGRKPLTEFLQRRREEVKERLDSVQGRLCEAEAMQAAEAESLEDTGRRMEEARLSVVELSRHEKEKVIEAARAMADRMVRDAARAAQYRLMVAKRSLKAELAERAAAMVEQRLQREISAVEDERLVEGFVDDLAASRRS